MVIYLSVRNIEQVVVELEEHYPVKTPAVVAYRVGWPDQKLIFGTLEDIAGKVRAAGIERQALILVGEALGMNDRGEKLKRSRLYDEEFGHGFRDATKPGQ
jgi:precorrin-4/cobalt-precorrin-4 C11-methyltransferase